MASCILPDHADARILQKMLRSFRERLHRETYASEQLAVSSHPNRVSDETLRGMYAHVLASQEQSNTQQSIFYWPLSNDPYHIKRCLIRNTTVSPTNIHIIPITELIMRLHPTKKNRFLPCKCTDHSKRIRLNWREFIYPQFVDLLFRRIQLPSTCPSPSTLNAHCIVNEHHGYTMEINRSACFLEQLQPKEELFEVTGRDLYVRYKSRHLESFGLDTVEGWRHFAKRNITKYHFKLYYKLSAPRLRVTEIMGGGYLSLKSTPRDTPYVVIASNFHLVVPEHNREKPNHYKVYVMAPDRQFHLLAHCQKRRIDSAMLGGALCMIVSSSPLRLEFTHGIAGLCMLVTEGICRVALESGYRLALWTKDHSYAWPLEYEVNDDMMHPKPNKLEQWYGQLGSRYDVLFNSAPFSTETLLSPVHGYTRFWIEEEVVGMEPSGACICTKFVRHELCQFNQYASMQEEESHQHDEFLSIDVQYDKPTDTEPSFKDRSGRPLRIVHQERNGLKLRALCRADAGDVPWCYFFVNRERTYLLFIPFA